jgi:hypothetical protein
MNLISVSSPITTNIKPKKLEKIKFVFFWTKVLYGCLNHDQIFVLLIFKLPHSSNFVVSKSVMALVDCIIKFGGSALTIKSQFETLNQKCLQE